MRFTAGEVRRGLALASGGIRISEYDDTAALLEVSRSRIRVTRSDDGATTEAEFDFESSDDTDEEDVPEQPQLDFGLRSALLAPTPMPAVPTPEAETIEAVAVPPVSGEGTWGGSDTTPSAQPALTPHTPTLTPSPTASPASATPPSDKVHVDGLLLSKILSVTPPDETIDIEDSTQGQRISTDSGTYYTLIPPPTQKIHRPASLPFGETTATGCAPAIKNTAPFAGDPKKQMDVLIVTGYADATWFSRSANPACLAAQQIASTEPLLGDRQRLLLRSELAALLAKLPAEAEWKLTADHQARQVSCETSSKGWNIRSVSDFETVGTDQPAHIEDWMEATPQIEFEVPASDLFRSAAAAKAVATYAPPTAATRDVSPLSVPYMGADSEKPKAKKFATLLFEEGKPTMIVSGHGWRYDRTAAQVGFLSAPEPGSVTSYFKTNKGELTVQADLLLAAVAAIAKPLDEEDEEEENGNVDLAVNVSTRNVNNVEGVVLHTSDKWFVLPADPDMPAEK